MTFRIFQNSTTVDASDSNDNFYHIAQGSISPMDGTLLGNTTGVLDLGSSSYRWNNIYVNSIVTSDLVTNDKTWETIYNDTLNSNSSSWQISIGNTDLNLYLFGFIETETSTATYIELLINGVTAGVTDNSCYRYTGGALPDRTNTSFHYILYNSAATTTAIKSGFFTKINFSQIGAPLMYINDYAAGIADTKVLEIGHGGGILQVSTTVSSISFVPSAGQIIAGSYLTIMRIST